MTIVECYMCQETFDFWGKNLDKYRILCGQCARMVLIECNGPSEEAMRHYYNLIHKEGGMIFYGWDTWINTAKAKLKPKEICPGQSCIDCRLPAPHAKPNHETGFLCKGCDMMRRL